MQRFVTDIQRNVYVHLNLESLFLSAHVLYLPAVVS